MNYANILPGRFISRPNRFIAHVEIQGAVEICHVKNTSRCRELLLPGVPVYVQRAENPNRKTKFDLISVYKGQQLVNIDSSAPNTIFEEYARSREMFGPAALLQREKVWGNSRFDFYAQGRDWHGYIEVKGVTLEEGGLAMFPDAPSLRGLKHVEELIHCRQAGYQAMIVFIIQMKGVSGFTPNERTHGDFAAALRKAAQFGVEILVLDCQVTQYSIQADNIIPIQL